MVTLARVGVVIGLAVAGFLAGRATAPEALAEQPAPSPAPDGAPASSGGPLATDGRAAGGDCDDLRRSLAAEREYAGQLEARLFGTPNPVPDEAMQQRAEAEYRSLLEEIIEQCGEGWTIREIACDETPCIGVLWSEAESPSKAIFGRGCPLLDEPRFGSRSMTGRNTSCNGEPRAYAILSFRTAKDPQDASLRQQHRSEVLQRALNEQLCPRQ